MLQALLAGVASIKAQQTRMNVIGNNLANVNTTAFKSSRVTFQDMIAQTIRGASRPGQGLGGTNPIQFGLGVLVSGTDTNNEQGSLSATNRPGDLAIQGNGYFMVSNGDSTFYTRDGAFDLDANGDLVQRATGQRVMGWTADSNGVIDSTKPLDASSGINVPVGQLSAVQVTSNITMAGNLKGNAPSTDSWTTTVRIYDALGSPHDITLKFDNRQDDTTTGGFTYDWSASEGTTVIGSSTTTGNAKLIFDKTGKLTNPTALGKITVQPGPSQFDVNIDFSHISGLSTDSQVQASSQNGFPPGSLQSYSIANDGTVVGIFTNGLTRPLGQVAMAIFPNPAGLERVGSNEWRQTDNSGIAVVGAPQAGGRGGVNSGFLEQSNVDIGSEFTDLIVTQRGFQANTRVVTTVDEMLQDLLSMKR